MDHAVASPIPFTRWANIRPRIRLQALSVIIVSALALATIVATWIVASSGMAIEFGPFLRFVVLAAAMLALSAWCAARYPDKRLAHAAAIVGTGTLSLMLCGIVSNAGLGLGAPLMDARLVAADALVGIHVDKAVRSMAEYPALIELLGAVYNASGGVVVALIALALIGNAKAKAWELTATVVLSMQVVAILSIAMPAMGAMAHLQMIDLQGTGLPAGAGVYHLEAFAHFRSGPDILQLADLSGLVTFPSFHTVLALLATQALWDTRLRWVGIGWSAAVIVSTIPIGGHYAADLAAGFLVWAFAAWLSRRAVLSSPSV